MIRATTFGRTALAAFALAVLVAAGGADQAAARERVPLGDDSHQQGCRMLQDRALELLEEYKDPNLSPAQREAVLAELRNVGSDWIAIGCKSRYGNILREALPGAPLDDLAPPIDGGIVVDDGGSQPGPILSTVAAADDEYRARAGRALKRDAAKGVLANDAGAGLSVSLVEGPAKGKLTLNADGSFVYAAKRGARGADRFVYAVRDGKGATDTATATIKIAG